MGRYRLCLAWLLPVLALPLVSSARAEEKRCNKARNVAAYQQPLPGLYEKISLGLPIKLVALGSSSTEGTGDIPQRDIYPSVLGRMLSRETLTPVEVVNKGKGGETIPDMVRRLERDVIDQKPDLVIWQLGVNDVLRFDGVEPVIIEMRKVLARLRAMKLPVVLVDLQVAPMVDRDVDTPRMQAAIAEAARAEGAALFSRHAMMESLIVSREAEQAELVHGDGLHMRPLAHLCTGTLLAKTIAQASLERVKPVRSVATGAPQLSSTPLSR